MDRLYKKFAPFAFWRLGVKSLAVRIREQVPGIPQEESNPAPALKVPPPDDEPSWPENRILF
jgi:hypothetical protein